MGTAVHQIRSRQVGAGNGAANDCGEPPDLLQALSAPRAWPELVSRRLALARAVERDIIPCLTVPYVPARQKPSLRADAPSPLLVSAAVVEEFTGLVLDNDASGALGYAAAICAHGLSHGSLYLDLLAPSARYLGDLWSEDLCDFTQVTIGLGRLHRILRDLTPPSEADIAPAHPVRHALLVPAPGEQHTFGLAMVTTFFRQAAWTVWSGTPADSAELAGIVRDNWFGVIGFSLGSEARLESLRAGITAVRRASRNRCIGIMVGGPAFIEHPELAAQVGADSTATDARQAVVQAQSLLGRLSVRV